MHIVCTVKHENRGHGRRAWLVAALVQCAVALPALDLSERDKQYHFIAGFVIGAGASAISYDNAPRWSPWAHFAMGVAASSGVGLLKEALDSGDSRHHTAEGDDALATSLGGVIGAGICLPFQVSAGRDTVVFSTAWRF